MNRLTIAASTIFAVIALSTTALAEQGHPEAGSNLSPEQFQKMKSKLLEIEKVKLKMLENYQKRLEIMQKGEACINAAANVEQLKACNKQEREEDKKIRDLMEHDGKNH